jgi:hypothetical protein
LAAVGLTVGLAVGAAVSLAVSTTIFLANFGRTIGLAVSTAVFLADVADQAVIGAVTGHGGSVQGGECEGNGCEFGHLGHFGTPLLSGCFGWLWPTPFVGGLNSYKHRSCQLYSKIINGVKSMTCNLSTGDQRVVFWGNFTHNM